MSDQNPYGRIYVRINERHVEIFLTRSQVELAQNRSEAIIWELQKAVAEMIAHIRAHPNEL